MQVPHRRALRWIAVIMVIVIAMLGVWTTAGLAQDHDSARAARSAIVRSLDPIKGRFHRVHGMTLKLHCGTCHGPERPDVLAEGPPAATRVDMPGRVDRRVCLGCHKASARPSGFDR